MPKSSGPLEIRPVTDDDFAGLMELYRHLSPDDHETSASAPNETFKTMLTHPGLTILAGTLKETLVATLTLVIVPNLTRGCSPFALIENVVTHTEYRGSGFGGLLIADAAERAWSAGCYKVMLMSGAQNQKAHRFYERVGFKQSKTGFEMRKAGYPSRKPI